jgi:hypothetical protein
LWVSSGTAACRGSSSLHLSASSATFPRLGKAYLLVQGKNNNLSFKITKEILIFQLKWLNLMAVCIGLGLMSPAIALKLMAVCIRVLYSNSTVLAPHFK